MDSNTGTHRQVEIGERLKLIRAKRQLLQLQHPDPSVQVKIEIAQYDVEEAELEPQLRRAQELCQGVPSEDEQTTGHSSAPQETVPIFSTSELLDETLQDDFSWDAGTSFDMPEFVTIFGKDNSLLPLKCDWNQFNETISWETGNSSLYNNAANDDRIRLPELAIRSRSSERLPFSDEFDLSVLDSTDNLQLPPFATDPPGAIEQRTNLTSETNDFCVATSENLMVGTSVGPILIQSQPQYPDPILGAENVHAPSPAYDSHILGLSEPNPVVLGPHPVLPSRTAGRKRQRAVDDSTGTMYSYSLPPPKRTCDKATDALHDSNMPGLGEQNPVVLGPQPLPLTPPSSRKRGRADGDIPGTMCFYSRPPPKRTRRKATDTEQLVTNKLRLKGACLLCRMKKLKVSLLGLVGYLSKLKVTPVF